MNTNSIVFVGGVFPPDQEKEILEKSKRRPQMAANNYQWSLIHGLDDNLEKPVTILNRKYIGSYPKNYSDAIIKESLFSHTPGAKDIDLGFVNVSVIRNFLAPFHEKKHVDRIIKEHEKCIFFFYSIAKRNLKLTRYIKRKYPDVLIAYYIPDLPDYVMLGIKQSLFVKLHRKSLSMQVLKTLKLSDANVLITKHQGTRLGIDKEKYITVEAIVSTEGRSYRPIVQTDTILIVYAGTLAKQYDVLDLVYEFMKIDNSKLRLAICGDGDALGEIMDAQEQDSRISYMGILNQAQLLELYAQASILVNPRNKKDYTKYSFPSKTIDYMLAGRPVICQQLEGIPSEYDDYLIYFDSDKNSENSLKNVLIRTTELSTDELDCIGFNNYTFASTNKNPTVQTKKILDFFKKKQSEKE